MHFYLESPDPFVVVTVDGEQTCTSPVVKACVDPYWGASFDLYAQAAREDEEEEEGLMMRCRVVTDDSVIVVQVFDQRHFKEPTQGFLGVVNVLVSSVINLQTMGTSRNSPPQVFIVR